MTYNNFREVRTVRLREERHPNTQDVWDARQYACEKCCIVNLEWFVPHYGIKHWEISPDDDMQDLINNLHIKTA